MTTILDQIEPLPITSKMVDDFRLPTQDGNEMHKDEGIVPGSHLVGITKRFGNLGMLSTQEMYSCSHQVAYFEKPIRIGSVVVPEVSGPEQAGDNYRIQVVLRRQKDNAIAVKSMLTYSPDLPQERLEQTGNSFVLGQEAAARVGQALGRKQMDLGMLAFGLASPALYKDGSQLVKQAAEKGMLPIYGRHKIAWFSPLEEGVIESEKGGRYDHLRPDMLKVGESIIIKTDAEAVARRVAVRAGKHKADRRREAYTAEVYATKSGILVYKARSTLAFRSKEEVLKDA